MGIEITLPSAPLNTKGDTNGSIPVSQVPTTPASGTAAVNTAVVVTVPASGALTIRITHLSWSYSAAPTGGNITVVVNGVTIWQLDIASLTDVTPSLPEGGLICQAGQSAVITLAAAGAAVVGKLNVGSYYGA